jgi:hypothetical protein
MLYYMEQIAKFIISKKQPLSILPEMEKLTGRCTAAKSDRFRASLRSKILALRR